MNKLHEWVNTALIGLVIILGLVGGNSQPVPSFSGITNFDAITLDNGGLTSTTGSNVLATTTTEKLVTGGTVVASSTTGTVDTITEAMLMAGSITYTPNTAAITAMAMPASSTLTSFIPNAGDMATVYFRNGTTTTTYAKSTITFVGGLGTSLDSATTTKILYAGRGAQLRFWRSSTSTDVYVTLIPDSAQ